MSSTRNAGYLEYAPIPTVIRSPFTHRPLWKGGAARTNGRSPHNVHTVLDALRRMASFGDTV